MNRRISAILLVLLFVLVHQIKAQEKVYLIPDRTSCASGDTIWFSTVVFSSTEPGDTGNVVHVQLDKLNGKHIARVSIVSQGLTGEGFLPVPDSLSTGVYVLKAFTNFQTADKSALVNQRLLTVYNRFDTEIGSIDFPEIKTLPVDKIEGIEIIRNKDEAEASSLAFTINLSEDIRNNVEEMIITARIKDPLSETFSGELPPTTIKNNDIPYMPIHEKNGLLIKGKILSNLDGSEVEGATVMLSISDTLPYFDYCISDSLGRFYFYLRNAYGTGNLVVQELSNDPGKNRIEFYENFIETPAISASTRILDIDKKSFAEAIVKAAYFEKFFKSYTTLSNDTFSLTSDFKYPFYGKPSESFFPELFIDLPDFQEIAREILRGVQYRKRKDQVSIRLFDYGTQNIFSNEPFKLLDGVPVFDPDIFTNMGTKDIKKVDAVFYKHYFGDLHFDGVLAVYTHQPSVTWVENQEGVELIRFECLQPKLKWNFVNTPNKTRNTPDFKRVLFRQKWKTPGASETIRFSPSDMRGDIVLDVVLVTKKQQILKHHKIFKPVSER
jgi:hypothetical protein